MPGKTHEAYFALLFRFAQRFGRAIRSDKFPGIVLEGHPVNLPQVQVVRLQPPQRLLQHLHGH